MRNLTPLCIGGLLVVGLGACGDDGRSDEKTMTLESRGGLTLIQEDNGSNGNSPGDERTFTRVLTQDGKVVGRLDGATTVTAVVKGEEQRLGTAQLTLRDGTIVTSGSFVAPPGELLPRGATIRPLVGGTGKYKGIEGTITQTPVGTDEVRNLLEYTLPED
jgi:hypothetical protein